MLGIDGVLLALIINFVFLFESIISDVPIVFALV